VVPHVRTVVLVAPSADHVEITEIEAAEFIESVTKRLTGRA
jgi:hypothetical protein